MQIDRMELADVGANPRLIAEAVFAQIPDISIPIPVEEIAQAVDIVEIRVEALDSFDGALVTATPEKAEASILVNAKSGIERQRYTIGHELGHYLHPLHIPSAGGFWCTSEDMHRLRSENISLKVKQEKEIQANIFAAELLLPRKSFICDLRNEKSLDLECIRTLASRYCMSKEATARRYVTLQDEPCAIVFSHNGAVRYVLRHDDFPWLDVRSGSPVPTNSVTDKWRRKPGKGISDWEEVDTWIWLSSGGNRIIWEQTLLQYAGYQMTLLTIDGDEDEDRDETDLEESWTPRF